MRRITSSGCQRSRVSAITDSGIRNDRAMAEKVRARRAVRGEDDPAPAFASVEAAEAVEHDRAVADVSPSAGEPPVVARQLHVGEAGLEVARGDEPGRSVEADVQRSLARCHRDFGRSVARHREERVGGEAIEQPVGLVFSRRVERERQGASVSAPAPGRARRGGPRRMSRRPPLQAAALHPLDAGVPGEVGFREAVEPARGPFEERFRRTPRPKRCSHPQPGEAVRESLAARIERPPPRPPGAPDAPRREDRRRRPANARPRSRASRRRRRMRASRPRPALPPVARRESRRRPRRGPRAVRSRVRPWVPEVHGDDVGLERGAFLRWLRAEREHVGPRPELDREETRRRDAARRDGRRQPDQVHPHRLVVAEELDARVGRIERPRSRSRTVARATRPPGTRSPPCAPRAGRAPPTDPSAGRRRRPPAPPAGHGGSCRGIAGASGDERLPQERAQCVRDRDRRRGRSPRCLGIGLAEVGEVTR